MCVCVQVLNIYFLLICAFKRKFKFYLLLWLVLIDSIRNVLMVGVQSKFTSINKRKDNLTHAHRQQASEQKGKTEISFSCFILWLHLLIFVKFKTLFETTLLNMSPGIGSEKQRWNEKRKHPFKSNVIITFKKPYKTVFVVVAPAVYRYAKQIITIIIIEPFPMVDSSFSVKVFSKTENFWWLLDFS